MKGIPERCFKCEWWDFDKGHCTCRFKAKYLITPAGGEVTIETHPGLIPEYLEPEFSEMLGKLFNRVNDVIDAWPGWKEIKRLEKQQECPGYTLASNRQEFTKVVPIGRRE